jgi:hypothetical protein
MEHGLNTEKEAINQEIEQGRKQREQSGMIALQSLFPLFSPVLHFLLSFPCLIRVLSVAALGISNLFQITCIGFEIWLKCLSIYPA